MSEAEEYARQVTVLAERLMPELAREFDRQEALAEQAGENQQLWLLAVLRCVAVLMARYATAFIFKAGDLPGTEEAYKPTLERMFSAFTAGLERALRRELTRLGLWKDMQGKIVWAMKRPGRA